MADVIEVIKSMMRSGATSEEIVDTLKSMGLDEDEARRLILLANRDMLRVLRNEIRTIAADAFEEKAQELKKDLLVEVMKSIDSQLNIIKKQSFKMMRDEVQNYISSLSALEDKVSILEKRVLSLEEKVYKERGVPGKKKRKLGYILVIMGVIALIYVLASGLKGLDAVPGIIVGVGMIIGGFLLG